MNIEILEFAEGAKAARGVTVIIDVFRAFSVACYAMEAGASAIIATSKVDEAFRLKQLYHNSILVGERSERKIEGFDLGNSPTEIIKSDIKGNTVIQTTTAGTNGLINAVNADLLLTGSLVNAGAVVKYIRQLDPSHVSLVAMGFRSLESAEEDLLCAEIIASGLKDMPGIPEKRISDLQYSSGKRFFLPANLEFSPPTDFFLCTMVNRFNFILQAIRRPDGNVNLVRIDV